jgi:hypothetical protein
MPNERTAAEISLGLELELASFLNWLFCTLAISTVFHLAHNTLLRLNEFTLSLLHCVHPSAIQLVAIKRMKA